MRVRLKGLNSKRKTLADGSVVTYWYAWKGGPRLKGEPGTPEFVASYNDAINRSRFPNRGALRFTRKNTAAVFYKAQGNVPFDAKNWTGTVSFWLKLDPGQELEPGYCDPLQITGKAYNDSAVWVDFTKDDKPRHFRLGVFGALKEWNPGNVESDKNPAFNGRLVVVKQAPFRRDRWTHVAIAYEKLGSGAGKARLYLNGEPRGETPAIAEGFAWDVSRGALRLGLNYTGLFDDLAVFRRALNHQEIRALARGRW